MAKTKKAPAADGPAESIATGPALKVFGNVEQVRLSELKAASYNPRRMPEKRMRQLEASILEFGLTVPLVVQRLATGELSDTVGGHQRTAAIRRLIERGAIADRDPLIPVIVRDDLTPSQVRKLNIALNEIEGEFDLDKKHALVEEIRALDGGMIVNPDAMGLDEDAMRALADAVEVPRELLDRARSAEGGGGGARSGGAGTGAAATIRGYKLVVPTRAGEQVVERIEAMFVREADVARAEYGTVEGFDDRSAALLSALMLAMRVQGAKRAVVPEPGGSYLIVARVDNAGATVALEAFDAWRKMSGADDDSAALVALIEAGMDAAGIEGAEAPEGESSDG